MKKNKSIIFCFLLITLFLSHFCFAQSPNGSGVKRISTNDRVCGYKLLKGSGVTTLKSESDAKNILDEIMDAAEMSSGAIEIRAADVDNAFACENSEGNGAIKRFILYNPSWLNDLIQEIGTDWTARAILAHEVGHHKRAHSMNKTTCNPKFEAEADEVAGEILAKLGATLSESQAAFAKIADDDGDDCYPSKADRLFAVKKGWIDQKPNLCPTCVQKFYFYYQFGDNPGNHFWKKIDEKTWTETYPTGDSAEIEEVGRLIVEGDNGVLIRHKKLTYYEYFIPDKGGKRMWLRIRTNGGAWSYLGEMKGIE